MPCRPHPAPCVLVGGLAWLKMCMRSMHDDARRGRDNPVIRTGVCMYYVESRMCTGKKYRVIMPRRVGRAAYPLTRRAEPRLFPDRRGRRRRRPAAVIHIQGLVACPASPAVLAVQNVHKQSGGSTDMGCVSKGGGADADGQTDATAAREASRLRRGSSCDPPSPTHLSRGHHHHRTRRGARGRAACARAALAA